MTTIAYRDGVLAADTLATSGEHLRPGKIHKIFSLYDGSLFGVTGEYVQAQKLLSSLMQRRVPPIHIGENARGIRIFRSGICRIYELDFFYEFSPEFCAWGSGADAALGALYAGASARSAVEIAAKVDPWTGGEITELRLED